MESKKPTIIPVENLKALVTDWKAKELEQDNIFTKIGEYMKKKRSEKGLSCRDLAKLTGVEASYINRIENCQKRPSHEVLCRIYNILDK